MKAEVLYAKWIRGARKACPVMLPLVGKLSNYPAEASLTVFRLNSADVPPTTNAR